MATLKKIAELRHRVTFQTPEEISDGQGGQNVTWVDFKTVWASVVPKSGTEVLFGERIEARTNDEIVIRDLGFDISEKMRIVFGERILHIKSIDRFENNRRFFQKIATTDKVGS